MLLFWYVTLRIPSNIKFLVLWDVIVFLFVVHFPPKHRTLEDAPRPLNVICFFTHWLYINCFSYYHLQHYVFIFVIIFWYSDVIVSINVKTVTTNLKISYMPILFAINPFFFKNKFSFYCSLKCLLLSPCLAREMSSVINKKWWHRKIIKMKQKKYSIGIKHNWNGFTCIWNFMKTNIESIKFRTNMF